MWVDVNFNALRLFCLFDITAGLFATIDFDLEEYEIVIEIGFSSGGSLFVFVFGDLSVKGMQINIEHVGQRIESTVLPCSVSFVTIEVKHFIKMT